MRLRKKTIWGKIDSKGNLDFYDGELKEFLKLHPNKNVIIRYEIAPSEPSGKTKAYYYNYVLPKMTRAFYETGENLSQPQVDRFLRSNCPSIQEGVWENGKFKSRVRTFDELDQAEANEFIEWVQEYASQNLYTIIDDPEV